MGIQSKVDSGKGEEEEGKVTIVIELSRYYTVPVAGPTSVLAQVDPVDSDCHRS